MTVGWNSTDGFLFVWFLTFRVCTCDIKEALVLNLQAVIKNCIILKTNKAYKEIPQHTFFKALQS